MEITASEILRRKEEFQRQHKEHFNYLQQRMYEAFITPYFRIEGKMPKIPIPNVDDMPTEVPELPEDISYKTIIRKAALSESPDKRGNWFVTGMELEVVEPEEYNGRRIFANYVPIPKVLDAGASKSEKNKEDEIGVEFVRMLKCTKVKISSEGFDTDDLIGLEPEVMAKNEEYQGRKSARVGLWLM